MTNPKSVRRVRRMQARPVLADPPTNSKSRGFVQPFLDHGGFLNSRLTVIVILRRSNRFHFRCGRTLPNRPDDREGHAPASATFWRLVPSVSRPTAPNCPRPIRAATGLAAAQQGLPLHRRRCGRPRHLSDIRAAAGQKSIVDNYTHVSHYVVMIVTKCGVRRGCGGGGASIALDARNLPSRRPSLLRGPRRSASRARNDRPHRRSRSASLPMVGFNNPGHTLIRRPSDVMPATPGPPDTHGRLT